MAQSRSQPEFFVDRSLGDQAARLVRNRRRIELACEGEGPLVYAVRASGIVRIFPA